MLVSTAKRITGGLSRPSKMPGAGYSLPALKSCPRGRELAKKKGTVCSMCYATRNRYCFSTVQTALDRRLQSLSHPGWVEAMTELISRTPRFFRWHDSGDIVSSRHLEMIMKVCANLPDHRFWIPTHEIEVVEAWVKKHGAVPPNVTFRISAEYPGDIPLEGEDLPEGVLRGGVESKGYQCPAPKQENKCGNCRACWSRNVPVVSYHLH